MHFQSVGLCLGLLFITVNAEFMNDGVEVEDVSENPEESSVKEDDPSSGTIKYKTPQPVGEVYFTETFDSGRLAGWVLSKAKKDDMDSELSMYDGRWEIEELKEDQVPGDRGLVLKSKAKHHAISAVLEKPFIFSDKPLIVQYEVNFQDGIDCGGAYIKLLADTGDLILENFYDKTSYTVMFGPDKCGEDYKLHFIFRHKHPKTGVFEEKHAKPPDVDLKEFFTDRKTHLYTLVMNPDDTFEIFIDQKVVNQGSLLEDVVPPINPPREIDDPSDTKPDEWDDRAKIPDPTAVKPEDWDENEPAQIEDSSAVKPDGWLDDEPKFIPNPNAQKPDDWNDDMDGEWEAPHMPNPACQIGCGEWKPPMIDNPKYKGVWKPPMINNPSYQGIWSPQKIPNPDYFEDDHPFLLTSFSALGLELWSMTPNIYFDNFIICSEKEVADRWAADGWGLKIIVANANEPGVLRQLTTAAEERPWLWLMYLVMAGLPIALLTSFCWPRKVKKKYEDMGPKTTDICKPQTKAALEQGVEEEKAPEKPEDLEEEKKLSDSDVVIAEKEEEVAEPEEKSEEEGETIEGQEEVSKLNKSASEDEMKEADESTGSGDAPVKSLRKRRVRKD
ncbi:calmegin [Mesocricetus auratus]|uniref:Calmegin n=1 Tax=Mesocricetus auratus TaxID=10036 RepID=A0A1U8CER7_MESAU|nr:calmegin [Mesocricetus auratus]XP_012974314.1 calmegin [Mesocricetus auratus]XP_040590777.1 calmegin [Mesocricetus auratus]